jgi:NADH dehydrogenase FAD-containing subunit
MIAAKSAQTPSDQVVSLIHSRDRVTDTMSPKVSDRAQHRLTDHDVDLIFGQRVEYIGEDSVTLAD